MAADRVTLGTGRFPRTLAGLALGLLGCLAVDLDLDPCQAQQSAPRSGLEAYYGFQPLEIYKFDRRIANLLITDLDGDKTDDILITNNARSRFDLLLSSKDAARADAPKLKTNELADDTRMRVRSLPVNKELVSVQVGEFSGDSKPDIVYYGNPAEIIILANQGNGRFDEYKRITSGEGVESPTALAVGDIDRDGDDDLVLLAAKDLVVIRQTEPGKLAEPERLPHTASQPRILKAKDLDGDGGVDLAILDSGGDAPLRIRLSVPGGLLGPERRFKIEPIQAIDYADIDGKPGDEVLVIEKLSGRARVLKLEASSASAKPADDPFGQLIFYPLPPGESTRDRTLDTGDLDGDGKIDVVVSDPTNAQVLVYLQGNGLGASQTYPGLIGGKTVKVADFDGDKKAEVLVLSEQEAQIGRSQLTGGRLSFPSALPIQGAPVALEVGDLDGDKNPEVLYLAKPMNGASGALELRALKYSKGEFTPFRWGDADSARITTGSGNPPGLKVLDVNQDGHPDILIFNAFGAPTLLLGQAQGPPVKYEKGLGPVASASASSLAVAKLDGQPALLVAQNTVARNVLLDSVKGWQVKDQYNPGRSGAQIQGVAVLDVDGDGGQEVILWDRAAKNLVVLGKEQAVYRPRGSISMGTIEFTGFRVADFNADGKDDLLIAGSDKFGIVLTGREGPRFRELASYESTRKDAQFADLVAGDLNADSRMDLVLADVAEHFVEIAAYSSKPGSALADLMHALSFPIFEEKSFRDIDALVEPRELGVGDVDGDGRTDLVLLVHDRVLIYRQDPGQPEKQKPSTDGKE